MRPLIRFFLGAFFEPPKPIITPETLFKHTQFCVLSFKQARTDHKGSILTRTELELGGGMAVGHVRSVDENGKLREVVTCILRGHSLTKFIFNYGKLDYIEAESHAEWKPEYADRLKASQALARLTYRIHRQAKIAKTNKVVCI